MYYRDRIKYWARLRWRKFSPQQLGAVSEKNRTQIDRLESQKIPLNQPTTPIAILIKRLISHQIGCLLTIRTQIYKKCTKSLTKSKCLFAKFTVMTRLYYAAKYKRLEYETALSGQLLKTWLADLSSSIIAKHNKESTFVTLLWLETTTA